MSREILTSLANDLFQCLSPPAAQSPWISDLPAFTSTAFTPAAHASALGKGAQCHCASAWGLSCFSRAHVHSHPGLGPARGCSALGGGVMGGSWGRGMCTIQSPLPGQSIVPRLARPVG